MNEKDDDENNYIELPSVKEIKISKKNLLELRIILKAKKFFFVYNNNHKRIHELHNPSFYKINYMLNSNPEEHLVVLYNLRAQHAPKHSSINSKYSRISSSLLSDCTHLDNVKPMNIKKNENDNKLRNNSEETIIFDNKETKKNFSFSDSSENHHFKKNINNNSKVHSAHKEHNDNEEFNYNYNLDFKKLFLFKWIYHFYLIFGIFLFIHYISFVFSKYNNYNFYNLIVILLIISMIYTGYFGIKRKNGYINFLDYILHRDYLFKINIINLIFSILGFIGFLLLGDNFSFLKYQGFIGIVYILLYFVSILFEIIYILFFDIINIKIIFKNSEPINNELKVELCNINK